MFDSVKCQYDLTYQLLSAESLTGVNIKNYRKMQLAKEIDLSKLWLEPRNGCCGAGILVEEPEARSKNPNVDGPVLDWLFPILVVENPPVNFTVGVGTFLTTPVLSQWVMDTMHKYADEKYGTFVVDGEAMQPDSSFDSAGIIAHRTRFAIIARNQQTPRTGSLQIALADGLATITCANDPECEIRYTMDGSGAARYGNPASLVYTGPIPVDSGQELRATGYQPGKIQSASRDLIIP